MSSSVLSKKRKVSGPDSELDSSWSPTYPVMLGMPPGPTNVSMTFVTMEAISGGGEVPLSKSHYYLLTPGTLYSSLGNVKKQGNGHR